jgi:anti-anti-sigma regulatory factor
MSFSPEAVASPAATPATPQSPAVERGHVALLCATEALDLSGSARFLERARPLERNCRCLVADLQNADFVDSDGVRALLVLAAELEAEGKELRLIIRPGSRIERTLTLLRLLERFQVFYTLEEAWRWPRSMPA